MKRTEKPLVSVCMITYNHGPYIREAIEGVLRQKCSFAFELVIGEDGSGDNTREICSGYASAHPEIRLLPPEANMGMLPNFFRTIEACEGEYIAFCEGDDYWNDTGKLQRQAGFLGSNPRYGMVCTDYSKYFQNTGKLKRNCFRAARYRNEVRFADYLTDMSTIGTATVMVRKAVIDRYLAEVDSETRYRFVVGDSPAWLFIAAHTGIAVMSEETAVYRILEHSACHIISPADHYRFVMNGLATADYFLQRFDPGNSALKARIGEKRLKATLYHAFTTMNRDLAAESYSELLKTGQPFRRRIWAWLMLAGSGSRTANHFITFILKQIRQGFGLR